MKTNFSKLKIESESMLLIKYDNYWLVLMNPIEIKFTKFNKYNFKGKRLCRKIRSFKSLTWIGTLLNKKNYYLFFIETTARLKKSLNVFVCMTSLSGGETNISGKKKILFFFSSTSKAQTSVIRKTFMHTCYASMVPNKGECLQKWKCLRFKTNKECSKLLEHLNLGNDTIKLY